MTDKYETDDREYKSEVVNAQLASHNGINRKYLDPSVSRILDALAVNSKPSR